MKTACDVIKDLLPLYCDEVCSLESKLTIEQHLTECKECSEELSLMQVDVEVQTICEKEHKIAEIAADAWQKGKKISFIKGCIAVLLIIAVLTGAYTVFHLFSTADENDCNALAREAAKYLGYDRLTVEEVEKRGDYLAALCRDETGTWCMCVFDRDSVFENRWNANGGKKSIESGHIGSWNYGSPQGEAILIFCGGNIPNEVCWYEFQNSGVFYTCPVAEGTVLDIFIIPDRYDINGYTVPLDSAQQEIK